MKFLKIKLLIIAVIMFAASSAFASYVEDFNVNTTSVSGQTGYLELQFNPGSSLGVATASVTNFVSDAVLNPASIQTIGDVGGSLPGTVTINNTYGWNDYFQQVTFGSNLNFQLALSGAAGNSFGLSFWDATGTNSILTSDAVNGFAATVDLNANGITVNNNSSEVTPTPIPAAAWLLGSGLMGLAGIRKRKQ